MPAPIIDPITKATSALSESFWSDGGVMPNPSKKTVNPRSPRDPVAPATDPFAGGADQNALAISTPSSNAVKREASRLEKRLMNAADHSSDQSRPSDLSAVSVSAATTSLRF
jgi:hypothetical protein